MAENISAISYTNKDFQTIYPELLDLATRISNRWTPDQTNESDPGIVLLKLAAICADKNNYNIDKNILECFPSSVTQMPNARDVFLQRGYYMRWYRSAEGTITISAKNDTVFTDDVTISDSFAGVTGEDGETVYTIVPTASNRKIPKDGTGVLFDVIQGVAKQYVTASGSSVITLADIDAERRLYFPNTSVAENGIFIRHASDEDYLNWVRVDNVDADPLTVNNEYHYEFGVSRDGSGCYVQFSDDISSVIGSGIELWYIATDGISGNIKANYLTKFANDVNGFYGNDSANKVTLNSDNIVMLQSNSMTDGKDPETIEEAYRGYTKTVGTFDTLVTLRDYNNALVTSEISPNGFVTDRTNDIQRTYQIITETNDINTIQYQTAKNGNTPLMNAFNLTIYAFQNVSGSILSSEQYNQTFTMAKNAPDAINQNITYLKRYFEGNNKSLQHDFITWDREKPLCIKNKYAVTCNIIPQYAVTQLQAREIKDNAVNALYAGLNSSKVDFGEAVTFDRVYEILSNADARIKSIALSNIEYTPYVSVCTGDVVTDIPLKSLADYVGSATNYDTEIEIFAKSVLAGVTPLFYQNKNIEYSLAQTDVNELSPNTVTTETKISVDKTGTKLLDGESVVFYAPSMIDDTVYSLGVKYVAKEDYSASATSRANIVMLWKKDNKYFAHKYENTYILPTFSITTSSLYKSIADNIPTTGVDVDISSVTAITNAWKDLPQISADQTLTVQKINQQTTVATDKCTWILNNVVNGSDGKTYWELFKEEENTSKTDSIQSYTLAPGEYFMLSDSNAQNLMIFGAGTQVSRSIPPKTTANAVQIPHVNYMAEQVLSEGMSSVDNQQISTGNVLTLTERTYISVGAGVTLKANTLVTIGNEEIPVNDKGISYDTVILPARDNSIGWSARSFLAFNTMDGAMKLSDTRQTVTFTIADKPDETVKVDEKTLAPVYIQTSPQYNLIGGENLSLQYYADYDQSTGLLNPNVVSYSLQTIEETAAKEGVTKQVANVNDDGSITFNSGTYTVTLFGATYDRIFRVQKNAEENFSITEIKPIKDDEGKQTLYYLISGDSEEPSITLTINVGKRGAKISAIRKIEQYPSSVLSKDAVTVVRNEVADLDVDGIFDYMYEVPSEKKIENPLDGASFNNHDHPYNQFTICQMNTDRSSVTIMNKLSAR